MSTHAQDPNPGDNCTIEGVTTDPTGRSTPYQYQYDSSNDRCGLGGLDWLPHKSPCLTRCGLLGSGYCCKPKNNSPVPPRPERYFTPPCGNTIGASGKCDSVNTALGPIRTDVAGLTKSLFGILLGLAGGVALLLIIAAGDQMMTSQGNPEKVKEARERLTSAIVGLLFIIFSVTILQIIGIDILHLPGFSR